MSLPNSYSTTPVPEHETVGGLQIALVIIGVAICLPAFITGAEIASALGAWRGLAAAFGGGLALGAIACLTGLVGYRLRLSSYMIILRTFGARAGRLINLFLSLSVLGWYGVLTGMFARTVNSMLHGHAATALTTALDREVLVWVVAGSALMVGTTIFGFKALSSLSRLATPLMVALLAYVAFLALRSHDSILSITANGSLSLGQGISITIGGLIIGATLMPDLARFARGRKDVLIAAMLSYGVGFPLVLVLSGIPTLVAGQKDLILLISMLGLGGAAMAILVLSTWTTNAFNLYVCTLVLGTVLPGQKSWRLTVAAGVLGTAFCFGGIGDAVVPYLLFIAAAIPPVAGVYLADFWIVRKAAPGDFPGPGPDVRWDAALSCVAGTLLALLADRYQVSITHIVPLDAALAGFLTYVVAGTVCCRVSDRRPAGKPG